MKMKRLMVAAIAAAITIGGTLPAYAAWKESGADWKYQNEDGSYKTSTWFEEAGKKYHFDTNGNAQKGWFKDADGKWYFFGYNGVMQTGLIKVDDKVYFMNDDGSLFVGTKKIDNTEYNFTEYGTTNGQPAVAGSHIWAGNGNQTNVVKGGGGYSSVGSSSDSTPTVEAEVKAKVDQILAEVKDSVSNSVSVGVTGNSITFNTTAAATTTTVDGSGLVSKAESAIVELFDSNEGVQEVTVAGKTYNRETVNNIDLQTSIQNLGYADKTVDEFVTFVKNHYSKSIKIVTTDGTLNYTIQ